VWNSLVGLNTALALKAAPALWRANRAWSSPMFSSVAASGIRSPLCPAPNAQLALCTKRSRAGFLRSAPVAHPGPNIRLGPFARSAPALVFSAPLRLPTLGQTFDLVPLHEALSRWFSDFRCALQKRIDHLHAVIVLSVVQIFGQDRATLQGLCGGQNEAVPVGNRIAFADIECPENITSNNSSTCLSGSVFPACKERKNSLTNPLTDVPRCAAAIRPFR